MKKRFLIITVLVIVLVAGISGPIYISYCKLTTYSNKIKAFNSIDISINAFLSKTSDGKAYFVIEDLQYPYMHVSAGSDEPVAAASMIKLPILAVILKAVENGELSLDKVIRINKRDITGGSGVIKAMKVPVDLRLDELLELMISRSDNTATNKIISLFGFDYYNRKFQEFGFSGTILKRKMMDFSQRRRGIENYITAADISHALRGFYCGEIVNRELSDYALKLLKKQHVNDRIPRHLPKDIEIAHKTGLEKSIVHDAGIVFSPAGDYIICVLTKSAASYDKAKKYIAEISLLTYNLYQEYSSYYIWQKTCCGH